jgi:hypothetical protein
VGVKSFDATCGRLCPIHSNGFAMREAESLWRLNMTVREKFEVAIVGSTIAFGLPALLAVASLVAG